MINIVDMMAPLNKRYKLENDLVYTQLMKNGDEHL